MRLLLAKEPEPENLKDAGSPATVRNRTGVLAP